MSQNPLTARYSVTTAFRRRGTVAKAEAWLEAQCVGRWGLEFLGLSEDRSRSPDFPEYVTHIRFNFGREEDLRRFRNEFLLGKPPEPEPPTTEPPTTKAATASKAKRRGLLGRLRG